jgi:hypothetical protein
LGRWTVTVSVQRKTGASLAFWRQRRGLRGAMIMFVMVAVVIEGSAEVWSLVLDAGWLIPLALLGEDYGRHVARKPALALRGFVLRMAAIIVGGAALTHQPPQRAAPTAHYRAIVHVVAMLYDVLKRQEA